MWQERWSHECLSHHSLAFFFFVEALYDEFFEQSLVTLVTSARKCAHAFKC